MIHQKTQGKRAASHMLVLAVFLVVALLAAYLTVGRSVRFAPVPFIEGGSSEREPSASLLRPSTMPTTKLSESLPVEVVVNRYLVQLAEGVTIAEVRPLFDSLGLSVRGQLPLLDTYVVRASSAPSDFLDTLLDHPKLAYIEPDYAFRVTHRAWVPTPASEEELGGYNDTVLGYHGFIRNRERRRGSPEVLIAVLDTGVDLTHHELGNGILRGYNMLKPDQPPDDDCGHGTSLVGLIVADIRNERGIDGAAYGCRILPVKVADSQGHGATSHLACGIMYAARKGAHILTMGLGMPLPSRTLDRAVDYAVSKGCLLLASAGNTHVTHCLYPAAFPEVLAVGGTARDGAFLSNETAVSPSIEIAAPAEGLFSTGLDQGYVQVKGTSVATALVSAAAGILRGLDPAAPPERVRAALRFGAIPFLVFRKARSLFNYGRLTLTGSIERFRSDQPHWGILQVETIPGSPRPGQLTIIELVFQNRASRPQLLPSITIALGKRETRMIDLVASDENAANPGDPAPPGGLYRARFHLEAPERTGELPIELRMTPAGASSSLDFRHWDSFEVVSEEETNLSVAEIRMDLPTLRSHRLVFHVHVRNIGNQTSDPISLHATFSEEPDQAASLPPLGPGGSQWADFAWEVPPWLYDRPGVFLVRIKKYPKERDTSDNLSCWDFFLAELPATAPAGQSTRPLRGPKREFRSRVRVRRTRGHGDTVTGRPPRFPPPRVSVSLCPRVRRTTDFPLGFEGSAFASDQVLAFAPVRRIRTASSLPRACRGVSERILPASVGEFPAKQRLFVLSAPLRSRFGSGLKVVWPH